MRFAHLITHRILKLAPAIRWPDNTLVLKEAKNWLEGPPASRGSYFARSLRVILVTELHGAAA